MTHIGAHFKTEILKIMGKKVKEQQRIGLK